jgi:nucleoside-diphosphate-sugar epimerase
VPTEAEEAGGSDVTGATRTVLVTGAMGQLGRRVTGILLGRGHTVVALDLDNDATRAAAAELQPAPGAPGRLTPAFVDLVDTDAVDALVTRCRPDAIVHLAAIVSPPCYRHPALARRVNVEGTRNLVNAARQLDDPPLFIEASSSSVYGSRNPHRHHDRASAETPVDPIECYGEDKVFAEQIVSASGLPHAILRLGGIISPDGMGNANADYLLLMRATPRDNRLHAVDVRDAALAFANAADRGSAIDGKILLIAGNETYALLQGDIEDDVMEAIGLGRLGPSAGLPGDPDDDRGWGLTDWFDTTEAQKLLDFQQHDWRQTLDWLADAQGSSRHVLRILGPLVRPTLRAFLSIQRRLEKRGPYADPWSLVGRKYGDHVLTPARSRGSSVD